MATERQRRWFWFVALWGGSVAVFALASMLLRYLVFGLMGAGG